MRSSVKVGPPTCTSTSSLYRASTPRPVRGELAAAGAFWAGHGAAVHALQPRQLEQSAVVDVGWRSMLSYCSWVYVPA